LIQKHITLRRL